uniref:Uncharacterized protein n=1 Tax=Oryza punctata TaxID=4537 RepID=A0A0E0MGA0_ORYPU
KQDDTIGPDKAKAKSTVQPIQRPKLLHTSPPPPPSPPATLSVSRILLSQLRRGFIPRTGARAACPVGSRTAPSKPRPAARSARFLQERERRGRL